MECSCTPQSIVKQNHPNCLLGYNKGTWLLVIVIAAHINHGKMALLISTTNLASLFFLQ